MAVVSQWAQFTDTRRETHQMFHVEHSGCSTWNILPFYILWLYETGDTIYILHLLKAIKITEITHFQHYKK